jgi:hypothetical protein
MSIFRAHEPADDAIRTVVAVSKNPALRSSPDHVRDDVRQERAPSERAVARP